jgi:hypothetical protein
VHETHSESCPMTDFGVVAVECSVPTTTVLVSFDLSQNTSPIYDVYMHTQ